ncbi:MAG: HAD-IA family hydrolase [Firmicutes bacterium]|nr:HAD-IA family hydrolase [Bacillota bacterium]
MYKLIVFDLDGTLTDTSLGIINSYMYASEKNSFKKLPREQIKGFIGQNLLHSFVNNFGISEDIARKVVLDYRDYYAKKGVKECKPYPGLIKTLDSLTNKGFLLAVATLKKTELAIKVLEFLGICGYFSVIRGMDANDSKTKGELILSCLNELGIARHEAVMVGDSYGDMHAALALGIDFFAVTFGFGFSDDISYDNANIKVFNRLFDICKYLTQN